MSALAQPSPASQSFAGLLAEFAAPEKTPLPVRDFDGLADDTATLSDEYVSRADAHHHSSSAGRVQPLAPEHAPEPARDQIVPPSAVLKGIADQAAAVSGPAGSTLNVAEQRKSAVITVRLTRAEDEQLRQRAAEAGMTVSAYLRSCAFEVETLRTQVKQTIAQMRNIAPQRAEEPKKNSGTHFSRLFSWKKRSA